MLWSALLRRGAYRRIGALELPGPSVMYAAHISHSGALLTPAWKGLTDWPTNSCRQDGDDVLQTLSFILNRDI